MFRLARQSSLTLFLCSFLFVFNACENPWMIKLLDPLLPKPEDYVPETGTVNQTPVADDFDIIGTGIFTYDGGIKKVTVTPKAGKSTGAITVKYNGNTDAPFAAGVYTVTFDVAAAEGFNAAGGLTAGDLTIKKAAGAAVGAPTLNTGTHDSIVINPVNTPGTGQSAEYGINTDKTAPVTGWQTGLAFTGLNAGTTYYIFARAAENNNYEAGAASGGLEVITLQTVSQDKIEYYWVDQHDNLVTTSGGAADIAPGSTLIITAQGEGYDVKQWYVDGLDTGQSGITYSFSSMTAGKHTVSVVVEKDGKPYSANIVITVQ